MKEQAAEKGHCLVVPPSTQTRVKVPVTLHKMVEECNKPLVGLSCVTEVRPYKKWIYQVANINRGYIQVLPISDQEMEPQNYCTLCSQQGQAYCMLLHLK